MIRRRGLLTGAAASAVYAGLRRPAAAQSCGAFYPSSPPAPATAAGYTQLLFADDFTVASTLAPTASPTSGYNWFLASNAANPANAAINTTATAASVSNGNTGAGSFASGLGGILTLNGPNDPGNGNVTIFSTPIGTQKVSNPGFGCWGPNVYIEIYAQYNPAFTATNQWYAPLWMWTQIPVSIGGTPEGEEVDFIENYCGNFGYADNVGTFGGHTWVLSNGTNPTNGGGSYGTGTGGSWAQTPMDANWHAYGMLWKSTGASTGTIQVFFDNQPQVIFNNSASAPYSTSILPVGTGGTVGFEALTGSSPLYAIMGGPPGTGGNINVDYFRVWAA